MNFNPRSREGSDEQGEEGKSPGGNFNPRSREGSDPAHQVLPFWHDISIHAPAKGATQLIKNNRNANKIPIHAPAKGETRI